MACTKYDKLLYWQTHLDNLRIRISCFCCHNFLLFCLPVLFVVRYISHYKLSCPNRYFPDTVLVCRRMSLIPKLQYENQVVPWVVGCNFYYTRIRLNRYFPDTVLVCRRMSLIPKLQYENQAVPWVDFYMTKCTL